MSKQTTLAAILIALTTINVAALALNLAVQAQANVPARSYRDLVRDRDFRRAVSTIVEDCTVSETAITC